MRSCVMNRVLWPILVPIAGNKILYILCWQITDNSGEDLSTDDSEDDFNPSAIIANSSSDTNK